MALADTAFLPDPQEISVPYSEILSAIGYDTSTRSAMTDDIGSSAPKISMRQPAMLRRQTGAAVRLGAKATSGAIKGGESNDLSTEAIVGIAVGVAGVFVLGLSIWWCCCR